MVEKEEELTEKVVLDSEELPKTIVRRVVKESLSEVSNGSDISVLRDSLLAFCEGGRIFIHHLSAAAQDVCRQSNRQIVSAEDVFKALEEIEFGEFVEPLRASLEEFRQRNVEKKSASAKAKAVNEKAKKKESPAKTGARSKAKESPAKNRGQSKRKEAPAKSGGRSRQHEVGKKRRQG